MLKVPIFVCFGLTLLACGSPRLVADEVVDAEKRVVFYPAYGYRQDGNWVIPMRIWVREEPGAILKIAGRAARGPLADRAKLDELDDEQIELYDTRIEDFIADSESRETVAFRFTGNGKSYRLVGKDGEQKTDRNGLIIGSLALSDAAADDLLEAQGSSDGWLKFNAVSDNHFGSGQLRLIDPIGLSVISDIDDTIKVTNIPAGEVDILRNTFFRDFEAAPCMSDAYREFDTHVAFHYVSGGPWQLFRPLADFMFSKPAEYPAGSFHMKDVRTNPFESESYDDIWRLVRGGSQNVTFQQKVKQIRELMNRFPERRFILIGDSGERDPEVFSAIKDEFEHRVQEIRIRDVRNDAANNPQRLAGATILKTTPTECATS